MTPPATTATAPAVPAARLAGQPESGSAPSILPERPQRSLSPSRAEDFVRCPLLYRLRAIDRLPEPASPAAVRGTLVHLVLEQLMQLPPAERTLTSALALVPSAWQTLLSQRPELSDPDPPDASWRSPQWLLGAQPLLVNYFSLEDPAHLAPIGDDPADLAGVEVPISVELPSGLALRGVLDRLDVSAEGRLRVVDYKSGRSPGPGSETRAMFQLRFYAVALLLSRGIVASELRLMYLADGVALRLHPDHDDLTRTTARIEALWAAIEAATQSGTWQARPSSRCNWCAHRTICPAWGGHLPDLPSTATGTGPGLDLNRTIDLTQGA